MCFILLLGSFFTVLLLLLAAIIKESAFFIFYSLFLSAFFWLWKEKWMVHIILSAGNSSCLRISSKES